MNYVDTVLTIGTVLLVSPMVVVLLTYTIRGTSKYRLGKKADPLDECDCVLTDEDIVAEEDCHACR
ncbi:MAG: hypothetical protein AAF557_02795 [Pseudomonadota bacterium]